MLLELGLLPSLYIIPVLIFSISFHEFCHIYAAYKLGDTTQRVQGRLTLDPLAHLDLLGFVSILLVGFGWGKPALVDHTRFKNKSRDMMLVALAGPLSNLFLAIVFAGIFKVLMVTNILSNYGSNNIMETIVTMILISIQYNIALAIFNLLPLPPLDGSKILRHFLRYDGKQLMDKLERYSFYIILILFTTRIASSIVIPVSEFVLDILFRIFNI